MKQNSIPSLLLACAFACVLALTGCGKPATSASSAPASPASVQSESTAGSGAADGAGSASSAAKRAALPQDTTDGANAMRSITPPYTEEMRPQDVPASDVLPPDLQQLYTAASYWMVHFQIATGFAIDYEGTPLTMDNGMTYYPDNGFASYSTFRAALDATFTPELSNKLLNDSQAYVDDGNDKLFSSDGARGADLFYKQSTFALTSVSDTEIVVKTTAHYAKDIDENGDWSEEEETKEFLCRLVKTEAGWRFAEFALGF